MFTIFVRKRKTKRLAEVVFQKKHGAMSFSFERVLAWLNGRAADL